MQAKGGSVIAVSVDSVEEARALVASEGLRFPVLSDLDRSLIRALGLVHPGGAPDGGDIAVPAMLLLEKGGLVRWRHRAGLIQERPDPAEVLAEIRRL